MVLLGDEAQLKGRFGPFGDSGNIDARWVHGEAQLKGRFGPFGDSGNIDARWVHGLCRTYHRLGNHFGRTRCNS